ncbi:MAG: tellurite resistance/C4-dicarboxylate transporter family protein [Ilumatobacteraceae bacterium]
MSRIETTSPNGVSSAVANLFPGYFALVMATGIVAIGAQQQKFTWLAESLYVVAAVAYFVLAVLVTVRLTIFTKRLIADITSHGKGFAFLTIVAATNVLGSATGLIHGWWGIARILWWFSIVLWIVLIYTALVAVILRNPKPAMGAGINGTWFLLTVSTESVAVLGALLLGRRNSDLLAFTCIAAFTLGIVLYLIVVTMVFLRWTFQSLEPTEADPPAWIAAGAVAITVLAGSNLLGVRGESLRIERLAPFIEGIVMLSWATATFWFPIMIAIGIWRHIIRRVPLRYHPSYWSLVFPLGMYGAASFKMRSVVVLDELGWLPKITLIIALIAWSMTFVGLCGQSIRKAPIRR